MSNLNGLFRQFVSTIANSAGGFVNAFDDSKDGIVLKAEFQANMAQNKADWVNNWNGEAGKYNDLVDSFWNSFDNIYKKGEIYDTNIQNAYALDRTESGKVQKQMDVFFKVNQLFDEALKGKLTFLSKYPEISNYIKGEVANNIIDNNIDDAENLNLNDLLNRINNVINSNADSIKNILLQDLLKNGSLNFNYTAVDGYNPLNDANLMTRINSSITGFSGGIEGLKEYLNSGLNNEIENISEIANAYLSDDAKLDVDNNYQIARLAAIYFEQAKNLIPSDLDGRLKEKALAKARETANEAAKEILSNNSNANLTLGNACEKTGKEQNLSKAPKPGEFDLTKTITGVAFYTYVKTLSLSDFNEKDDKAFFDGLVEALIGKGYTADDAKDIAQYLADHDKNIAEFQALIEFVAEKFNCGDIDKDEINKTIIDAIVNGNMGTSTTSWLSWLADIAGVKSVVNDETNNDDNSSINDVKKIDDGKYTEWSDIQTQLDKVQETSFCEGNINTKAEAWDKAKEEAKKLIDKICKAIKAKLEADGYNSSICEKAANATKDYYYGVLDDIDILNCVDGAQGGLYAGGDFCVNGSKLYYKNDDMHNWKKGNIDDYCMKICGDVASGVGYKVQINSEKLLNTFVTNYNNYANEEIYKNSGEYYSDFESMGNAKPLAEYGYDYTMTQILDDTDTKFIGGIELCDFTIGVNNAKYDAILKIHEILDSIGAYLKANGFDPAKIDRAIITTKNYYESAITAMSDFTDEGTPKNSEEVKKSVTYYDVDGDERSEEISYSFWGGKDEDDSNITTGAGMLNEDSSTGLRLEEAHNGRKGANTFTIGVNISALFKNIQRFLG